MKNLKSFFLTLLVITTAYSTQAQHSGNHDDMHMKGMEPSIQKAVCMLYPTKGNTVSGVITFTKVEGGIRVVADLTG